MRIWNADTSFVSERDYRATLFEQPKAWTDTVTITRTVEVQVVSHLDEECSHKLSYRIETNGRRTHGLKRDGYFAGGYTRLDCGEVEDAILKAQRKRANEAYRKWKSYKGSEENFDSAPAIEIDGDGVYKTPCLVCNELFLGLELDYLQTKITITDDDETYDHTVRGLVCSTCDTDEYLKEVIQDVGYLMEENKAECKDGVPDLEPTHFNCCHAPKDMGHMFGCPNSTENKGGE